MILLLLLLLLLVQIKEIVSRSQTMNEFENEMDEWMIKREELSHKADQLKQQRDDLLQATEVMDENYVMALLILFCLLGSRVVDNVGR